MLAMDGIAIYKFTIELVYVNKQQTFKGECMNSVLRFVLIALAGFIPSIVAYATGSTMPTWAIGLIVAVLAAVEKWAQDLTKKS